MKLSPELNSILNQQVVIEYENELKYRKIQSYFEDKRLPNLSKYFKKQADEENSHAQKIIDYVNDRLGGKIEIGNISKPENELTSCVSVGEFFLDTEESTTESLSEIYNLALEEKSFIDLPFIQNMLLFQIEEEKSADTFLKIVSNTKDYVLLDAVFEKYGLE